MNSKYFFILGALIVVLSHYLFMNRLQVEEC